MKVTARPLSIFSLLTISGFTFLRLLPYLVVIYLIPAFILMLAAMPVTQEMAAAISQLPAEAMADEVPQIIMSYMATPNMLIVMLLSTLCVAISSIFSFIYVESAIGQNRLGLLEMAKETFKAIGRYISAYAAYFGVLIIFLFAPVIVLTSFDLTPLLKIILFIVTLFFFVIAALFVFTSIFFSRAAVLRGLWPNHIFYYSYEIAKSSVVKIIVYLVIAAAISFAGAMILRMLSGLLLGIFSIFIDFDGAAAASPFMFVINVFAQYFMSVALSVYFVNTDYVVHPKQFRGELFSRVSGVNDTSMPIVK